MKVAWRVPQQVLQFRAENDEERAILPLLVPGSGAQSSWDGDIVEWYSAAAMGITEGALSSECMMLKTYDAAGVCLVHDLQEALRPDLRERLAQGGAFQLVLWGQGGAPSFAPQRASPLQCLGTEAAATGAGPAP